ncbi:hypothetical protein V5O48_014919 [Marasmius crinis-equi]|uniref:Uncharacterized protein n=1 Tax=Marasmius crinis-equi TaxID=585013 RepID=A0ABR3EVX4_9AGAR
MERLVGSYRKDYGLSVYSDTFMIVYGTTSLTLGERQRVQPFLEALENHLNVTVLRVESAREAAEIILLTTSELEAFVNNPENERLELRNTYARMLMVIPGMNVSRTEMVMQRCSSMRSLRELLKTVKEEYRRGRLQLNSSLFTREPGDMLKNVLEGWVENLYIMLCSDDSNAVLHDN